MTKNIARKPDDLKKAMSQAAKLVDVAKAGNSKPSATSRPVISSHPSVMKHDPMVTEAITDEPIKDKPLVHVKPKVIAVPTHEDDTVEPPAVVEPLSVEEKEPEPEQPKPVVQNSEPNAAGVDALANEVTSKRQSQQAEEAQNAATEAAEKSIASREFYVPIKSSQKASHLLLIFVLILVAGALFSGAAILIIQRLVLS